MTTLNPEELNDACLHAAATMVVAFSYGCSIESCRIINNDKYPTPGSDIRISMSDDWEVDDEIILRPAIHEAGAMAVAKSHGRRPHRLSIGGEEPEETARVIGNPEIWKAIKILAQFIKDGHSSGGEDFSEAATSLLESLDIPVATIADA